MREGEGDGSVGWWSVRDYLVWRKVLKGQPTEKKEEEARRERMETT